MENSRPKIGVAVYVLDERDRILLGYRKGPHGNGCWGTPGGHLEFGESPEECARRESAEEAGIELSDIKTLGFTNDVFKETGKHYVTLWLSARLKNGKPEVLEPDRFREWGWFPWEALPEPLFLPVVNFREIFPDPTA